MLIKKEVLDAIKAGEIDLQFRRWMRRTVKPGGTLKTRVGILGIGEITRLEPEEVTLADAKRAGFADLEDFFRWLKTMKPGELDRIEVSYVGEDPLIALANDGDPGNEALRETETALSKLDGKAPWTRQTLELIEAHPGRLAEELGRELRLEKAKFKAKVTKLKALGLTESLETGYRLSPRGQAVLAYLRQT